VVEKRECKFKPEIDRYSMFLMTKRDFIPPEDRLLAEGKKYKD